MHLSTPLVDMELADRRDARTYSRAMMLRGEPTSSEGQALVALIVDQIISPYHSSLAKQLRPSSVGKFRQATGPFLADLFVAAALGLWSKRGTNTNSLTGVSGGPEAFRTMRAAMGAAGLIEELKGYVRAFDLDDTGYVKAARTSFRPTGKLLEMAQGCGIALADVPRHFTVGRPPEPKPSAVLEARSAKEAKDARAKQMPVDPADPKAAKIIADLERLNQHLLAEGRIEGIAFAGLRRIFSNANRPGFDWQWHGRYYSMPEGDGYETMEGGSATRVRVLRIDGEPVQEVDIRGAHLTILHGLLGVPFDHQRDPYEAYDPGATSEGRMPSGRMKILQYPSGAKLDRETVKDWLLLALGASDSAVGGPRHNAARRAALARYPFLADLPKLGIGTLDLQYHEAQILRLAMEELMVDHGVGFLPVHDALVVPQSKVAIAKAAIEKSFRHYFLDVLGKGQAPVPIIP